MDYDLLAELLLPDITETPDIYEQKYPERKLEKGQMVTRFAPSPTGFIHMGSLYIAFLYRLLVSQFGGVYYLRIEDTDQKREVTNGIKMIEESLDTFGITVDESPSLGGAYGPYIQSQRQQIYKTYVKSLIKKGLAYPCFCTPEELDEIREKQADLKIERGYYGEWATSRNLSYDEIKKKIDHNEAYVIRLKAPNEKNAEIECNDIIKGKIMLPVNNIDIVLLKADGLPTYHLAHVIDDHLMRTTHVIRGDEWLSSTPIHLQLFNILGFDIPFYAHVAPLTKKDGNSIRKLSKRKDPECAASYYQELGIPPEALKIYFATITNSNFEQWYEQDKTLDFSAFTFSFDKMAIGGTLFDMDKLISTCKIYFSLKSAQSLYDGALEYYKIYDDEFYQTLLSNKDYAIKVFDIERNNARPRKDISCYKDIKKETWYMFDELYYSNISSNIIDKENKYDLNIIDQYINSYFNIEDSQEQWYNRIKDLAVSLNYAPDVKSYKNDPTLFKGHIGDICEMIRYALTEETKTPSLYEIQVVLGLDRIKERLSNFKKRLNY